MGTKSCYLEAYTLCLKKISSTSSSWFGDVKNVFMVSGSLFIPTKNPPKNPKKEKEEHLKAKIHD